MKSLSPGVTETPVVAFTGSAALEMVPGELATHIDRAGLCRAVPPPPPSNRAKGAPPKVL